MRSEDIIARADAVLGRAGRNRGGGAQTHRLVNRKVQVAIIVGAILIVWLILSRPFWLVLIGLCAGAYALTRGGSKPAKKATAEDLPLADLATLPLKTELWLASQRRMLPVAAQSFTDSICKQLKALAGQIADVNPADPIAHDIRRLIAKDLPDLINDYHRVPAAQRKVAQGSLMPDQQLAQGLIIIDGQLEQICARLAAGPVTKLATQARYLDLKYQGEAI